MTKKRRDLSRRDFLRTSAAAGVGATALAGLEAGQAQTVTAADIDWDHEADVVIAGAGAAGLCASVSARDQGVSVVVVEENHDIGGHAMVSGGRIPLGGGTSFQRRYGIEDSAEQVFLDHTNHENPEFIYSDRELVRTWADENVPTFEFLVENGVKFMEQPPSIENGGTVPRLAIAQPYSDDLNETINGSPGSGLARAMEASARQKGVEFLLRHKMTRIIRESATSGRVLGITTSFEGRDVRIRSGKGVILATGGHTSNVDFRTIFDPRLTDEYQVAGEPWSRQTADSETLAMDIGASLWATANQANELGRGVTKTSYIGCRYGYRNLQWSPDSPMFTAAGASGLGVTDWQNVILVNQVGRRFWDETERGYDFCNAALGTNGGEANGGGPIWAIFDSAAVTREGWEPTPPNVDPDGWFFTADSVAELASRIANPHQKQPVPARALEETVARYNGHVDRGEDPDFGKATPRFKIQTPPFYAAWSTPILHDTLTGLKITSEAQVVARNGETIPRLYCAGESAGGFALHGLPRCTVFGRIAGREAARLEA